MSLTYGYDLKEDDKILEAPVQAGEIMSPLLLPGGALVNHLSFCAPSNFIRSPGNSASQLFSVRYIPSWVPYLSYEPLARIVRKLGVRIRNEPIDFVKNALVSGDDVLNIHANW
jgi:hypothetical protein